MGPRFLTNRSKVVPFFVRALIAISFILIAGCENSKDLDSNLSDLTPEEVFSEASPFLVTVLAFDDQKELIGFGSGILIGKEGRVLTNYHVLEKASSLEILLADHITSEVNGIIASDQQLDYVILKSDINNQGGIKTGDSSKIKVGQRVFTISSPQSFLYQNTFSSGEVSGIRQREMVPLDKNIQSILGKELIQFTSPISSGSSGGALLNQQGELVGLVIAQTKDGQNINFAIPINEFKESFNSKSLISFTSFKKITAPKPQPTSNLAEPVSTPEKDYSNTTDLDPEFTYKDLVQLGNKSFQDANYSLALSYWALAHERNPKNVVVLNKMAYALVRLNEPEKAVTLYEEALKIDPNHYLTIFNLGELAHQSFLLGCTKCKEEAQGLYLRALELDPPPHVKKQAEERILMLQGQ